MTVRRTHIRLFPLLLSLGLPIGVLAGMLIGSSGLIPVRTGISLGLIFTPLVFGLIGLVLDRRSLSGRALRTSAMILVAGSLIAGCLFWWVSSR